MGYIGYCDGDVLFAVGLPGYEITSGQITKAINEADGCTITLPPTNRMAHAPVKRRSIISVKNDGNEIFRGTIANTQKDFLGNVTFQIDGALAWLREIVRLPFTHSAPVDADVYFYDILGEYNYQRMGSNKMLKYSIRGVAGTVKFDHSTECTTSFDSLSELVSEKGGYIITRYGDAKPEIVYLASANTVSPQTIEFGKNLLSLENLVNSDTLVTRVWPIGKDGLTIGGVNDGADYLVNSAAEATYGRIDKTVQVDSDDAAAVKSYGQAYLTRYATLSNTFTLTAVDLSLIDKRLSAFSVGDQVRIISPPHGVDATMQVTEITTDLVDPAKSTLTLGAKLQTLTDAVNGNMPQLSTAQQAVIGGTGGVQSVNYVLPDSGGNVQLTPQNVGAVDEDEELTILEVIEMWNNA